MKKSSNKNRGTKHKDNNNKKGQKIVIIDQF